MAGRKTSFYCSPKQPGVMNMGKGFLELNVYLGNGLLPLEEVKVTVKDKSGEIKKEVYSNSTGKTIEMDFFAPDIAPKDTTVPQFSIYDVEVTKQNYQKVYIYNVEIFDKQTTVIPVQLHPMPRGFESDSDIERIYIDNERAVQECQRRNVSEVINAPETAEMMQRILANEVVIPEYITVHLGSPNDDSAENYRLRFIDYLKNVASREVFPSWTEEALRANILVQMTFALNRIYTLWYSSQGKNFDITNRTQWDQAFDKSKGYFEIMGRIVDEIFTKFIRRQGRREPFFSSYCNGTTSTCDGLHQCGSQELALAGYNYLQILKHYYPNDIQIVESDNFGDVIGKYSGTPLREGSTGENVLRMQQYLNRISGNWYVTPIPVQDLNGVYGVSTKNAVTMFQQNTPFNLSADGVIGKNTWNAITLTYNAAKGLAELHSEGERIGIGATPPTVTLYPNTNPVTRGQYVVELQFLLNYIAQFYSNIPEVIQNGVFREDTKRSVIQFQQYFGLTPDGIVGPGTWRTLYNVFNSLQGEVPDLPDGPELPPQESTPFPGYLLRIGSRGDSVALIQNYLNAVAQVYTSIPILATDGIFGAMTDQAVREFQRLFGLAADGIIGPITWYEIMDVYNRLANSALPQFPGTSLRIGSRGNDVLLMQKYLNSMASVFPSIPVITADGVFGNNTADAVREFQRLFGLTADGIIGRNTWERIVYIYNSMPNVSAPIFPGTALREGSSGNNVNLMQRYLNEIARYNSSIPSVTVDGIFGAGTKRTVTAFQNKFGLSADGVIGRNTWNKIVSIYNILLMES